MDLQTLPLQDLCKFTEHVNQQNLFSKSVMQMGKKSEYLVSETISEQQYSYA